MRCPGTYVSSTGIVTVPEIHWCHKTNQRDLKHPNYVVQPSPNASGLLARIMTTEMLGRIVVINAQKLALRQSGIEKSSLINSSPIPRLPEFMRNS